MKVIELREYNQNIIRVLVGLKATEIKKPMPSKNQILIKIMASPCNPSDIAFMRGGYNIQKVLPKVLGFEASGIVVEAGGNPEAQKLIGKRVCCFTQEDENGTWAEYFATDYTNCLVIKDELSYEQAACFFINPFTAFGLMQIAIENKSKAIIQTAAGGQLASFIRLIAKKNNIEVINIVRNDETLKSLEEAGEKHNLNLNAEDFDATLKKLATELNATTAFDAVGGNLTGQIFNCLPKNSKVVLYGGLSGVAVGSISPLNLIFKNSAIMGFNLNAYIENLGVDKFTELSNSLQDMIINNEVHTEIQGSFPLEEAGLALKTYISNMSKGKILFKPHGEI
ncbi:MAG: zinc-binding dehydrogenase [Saprospiraceae bacterium]|nr:zinc-binding dehydrogenase [Saprospiraceae bacterium]